VDAELEIRLGDVSVGVLSVGAGDHCTFRLHRAYRDLYPRPVLGQLFEDDLERVHRSTVRLPPFFSNLLPEGELRRMVAREAGVKEVREPFLLARLGEDLPGAVQVVPQGAIPPALEETTLQSGESGSRLRFSLAGVQLKFSMQREGTRFTLPMTGRDGTWLVKLPDFRFERVPEVEYATMRWAQAAGIDVPEHELVSVDDLDGLPPELHALSGHALAVRRFDRCPDRRGHQEDFAQVFGLYPDQKYDAHNYESIALVVLQTAGQEAFHAFVDRLVFVVLSGNADAHHKNWSLRYPDGHTAELSPAYDQVATVLYVPAVDDFLALNFARSKQYRDVSLASFQRLGRKLGLDPEQVARRARDAVRRIRDAWAAVRAGVPLTDEQQRKLEDHWRRIPLVHEAG
jgi:serine/threonine-protein kinase HipA